MYSPSRKTRIERPILAVTEFADHRERVVENPGSEALGKLAHDLRNLMSTARTAFDIIKRGQVGLAGSTGMVLDRSLRAVSELIDGTLANMPSPNPAKA